MREKNYPDPDKKIIYPQDWLRFFSKNRKNLDMKEEHQQEDK